MIFDLKIARNILSKNAFSETNELFSLYKHNPELLEKQLDWYYLSHMKTLYQRMYNYLKKTVCTKEKLINLALVNKYSQKEIDESLEKIDSTAEISYLNWRYFHNDIDESKKKKLQDTITLFSEI